ncbi:MAG: carbamoyltransferase HypF [Candidatus Asgardarchaeum sp.]
MKNNESLKRAVILCSGVVQGIGFRPFVYRIAVKYGLVGYVLNLGDAGVKIIVEGQKSRILKFIDSLKNDKPPLAYYSELVINWEEYTGEFDKFEVKPSDKSLKSKGVSYIPPDIALCDKCKHELFDPNDRRYMYPFIVCSHCGPRFTVIEELPYDRERTSMRDFPMCEECYSEYTNPLDRRYHAEPICCPKCGPRMILYEKNGEIIDVKDPIREAAKLIEEGYIVAIKGIGGTHLATKTTDDDPIILLRKRRRRPQRPFAIMAKNIETIRSFAVLDKVEEELLLSYRRPIVILKKKIPFPLSEHLAPGLDTIGVMLPYSGIHEILMHYTKDPALVMTSGNYPGEPMAITNEEAFKQLKNIADYFLLHNRRIVNRNDDSVVKIIDGKTVFLRKSRGYVPEPIEIPFFRNDDTTILALGPELNVTFTILKGKHAYISQHIGDVENLEMINFLENAIDNFKKVIVAREIHAVVSDAHPVFYTTRLAEKISNELSIPHYTIQHHHAHVVSLLGEYGISPEEEVVAISADGFGLGDDGNAWGGEIFIASYTQYKRVGHLKYVPMPGGDLATKYPIRMVAGLLSEILSYDELREILSLYKSSFKYGEKEIDIVIKQIRNRINTPMTSSLGRFLDAVSTTLGICDLRTYEGEPAIKLEAAGCTGKIKNDILNNLEIIVNSNDGIILDTPQLLYEVLELKNNGENIHDIAATLQHVIGEKIGEIAIQIARENDIRRVLFTGGVAYNSIITRAIRKIVTKNNLTFITHQKVPPGDGGISFGQAIYGKMIYKDDN